MALARAHLPPSATAVGGQRRGQRGQHQRQRRRNPAGQQRPAPHGPPGAARSVLQSGWLGTRRRWRVRGLVLVGAGGGQHGPGWWAEAATAGSAASYSVGAGGTDHRTLPGRATLGHGAQTMGSERGRGSRPSEPAAAGLAVGVHPRPLPVAPAPGACTGRRPLPLGRLPRAPAVRFPSAARRGAAAARGRGDYVPGLLRGEPLRCPAWVCPLDGPPSRGPRPLLPGLSGRRENGASGRTWRPRSPHP